MDLDELERAATQTGYRSVDVLVANFQAARRALQKERQKNDELARALSLSKKKSATIAAEKEKVCHEYEHMRDLVEQERQLRLSLERDLSHAVAATSETKARLARECDDMHKLHGSAQSRANELQSQLRRAKEASEAVANRMNEEESKARQLREQLLQAEDAKQRLEEEMKTLRTEHSQTILELKAQVTEGQLAADALQADCAAEKQRALTAALHEGEERARELRSKDSAVRALNDEVAALQKEKRVLTEQLYEGKARCSNLETQLAAAGSARARAVEEDSTRADMLANEIERRKELEDVVRQLKQQIIAERGMHSHLDMALQRVDKIMEAPSEVLGPPRDAHVPPIRSHHHTEVEELRRELDQLRVTSRAEETRLRGALERAEESAVKDRRRLEGERNRLKALLERAEHALERGAAEWEKGQRERAKIKRAGERAAEAAEEQRSLRAAAEQDLAQAVASRAQLDAALLKAEAQHSTVLARAEAALAAEHGVVCVLKEQLHSLVKSTGPADAAVPSRNATRVQRWMGAKQQLY